MGSRYLNLCPWLTGLQVSPRTTRLWPAAASMMHLHRRTLGKSTGWLVCTPLKKAMQCLLYNYFAPHVLKYASLLFTGEVHLSHHKLKKRNEKAVMMMMLLFLNGGGVIQGFTGKKVQLQSVDNLLYFCYMFSS